MDATSDTVLLSPCQTCFVGYLSVSEPDRCASHRTGKRTPVNPYPLRLAHETRSKRVIKPFKSSKCKQNSCRRLQGLSLRVLKVASSKFRSVVQSDRSHLKPTCTKRWPKKYWTLQQPKGHVLEFYGVVHHFVQVQTINHQIRVMAITNELVTAVPENNGNRVIFILTWNCTFHLCKETTERTVLIDVYNVISRTSPWCNISPGPLDLTY